MSEVRVLKFGGSSVATPEHIHNVAKIVNSHYQACGKVIVVVSAMGKSTDELVGLASQVSDKFDSHHRRELDMLVSVGERVSMALLSMAIRDLGIEAVSLTGSQSGIITTETHGEASILEIKGERIRESLDLKKVVIVAGFQGVSRTREITTLGRGGSDTTALALAVFAGSGCVRIYSDVDGYYSADPKVVPKAIRYSELPLELASLSSYYGARVLHYRAADLAAKHQVEIHLLSTFNPQGQAGLLRGSVMNNIEQFQVFTLNVKKRLRKLTTIISPELDKGYLSALEGLSHPPICGFDSNKMFFHFVEMPSQLQEVNEKFSLDPAEYWKITFVGTGLTQRFSFVKDVGNVMFSQGVEIEAYEANPLAISFTTKAFPEKEKELLAELHKEFIEMQPV